MVAVPFDAPTEKRPSDRKLVAKSAVIFAVLLEVKVKRAADLSTSCVSAESSKRFTDFGTKGES